MKKLDKYPKLDGYATKLQMLINALSDDKTKVSAEMVNELVAESKGVTVDSIINQASGAFSLNAKTDEERCDNIHQAERALRLCMLLEGGGLVPSTNPDRWRTIGIKATNK